MSIPTEVHGVTYPIPETRERFWDGTVTDLLKALAGDLDGICSLLAGVPILTFSQDSETVLEGATIDPARQWRVLTGSPGAVRLSTSVSISPGGIDGQVLVLTGSSDTSTVTIVDGSGVTLNGDVVLGEKDCIALSWDGSTWQEIWRNS